MFSAKDTRLTRPSGAFVIPRSLRFRASASAYLTRTVASTGDRQKATWSGWVKKGQLAITAGLFASDDGAGNRDFIRINGNDKLNVSLNENTVANLITTQVFRDTSAWYHFIVAIDTTQATAANRIKLYVNGVQITVFDTATYPSQNANFVAWNVSGKVQDVGDSSPPGAGQFFDGYMAEVNWIDGQQLTPTSFGAISTTTGVWSPIKYTGSYGTNGYHLTFNSYATQAALGTDTSGNSNTFTVNNCSVTAGVTYDSMIDVPTVTSAGSNYCVISPIDENFTTATAVVSDGNLKFALSTNPANQQACRGTQAQTAKFYFEVITLSVGAGLAFGIKTTGATLTSSGGLQAADAWEIIGSNGNKWNVSSTAYGSGYTTNDIGMCAVDPANGKIWFGKNGTWFASGDPAAGTNAAFTNVVSSVQPLFECGTSTDSIAANFGQRPFSYTPPTGFNSLNTYNLAAPSILKGNLYMDATTYTGTGASQSITSLAMQPDFTWLKARSSAENHRLFDSVRGVGNSLLSNATNAEASGTDGVSAFNSNGFTLGTNSGNTNAVTYVSWNWKGGGAAVTNTSGSITSSVSASAASGFSVVTYTGTGANATVGHGLGVAPRMMIIKQRSGGASSGANDWNVYHANLTSAVYYIRLNLQNAEVSNATVWNSTAPSSTVFSLGSQQNSNELNGLMVAYCFAQIAGYSAFGSYVGNGSADGTFVYTGFRPRWLMTKQTDGASEWDIIDTARDTYNLAGQGLRAHTAAAEYTPASSGFPVDIVSNGFKWRVAAADPNRSGNTYIYAAFAENPFNNSLAR